MSEIKPIRSISWKDPIINFALGYIGGKILDFLWKEFRTRIRFVGKTHMGRYLFFMFGDIYLSYMVGYLIGFPFKTEKITKPQDMTESEFNRKLLRLVMLHKRYHDYVGKKPCSVCPVIYFYRNDLEKHIARLAHENYP
jgi:hypothetical protein